MIKVTGKRTVRQTTAPYIQEDGTTADITVEYYSLTTECMRERVAAARKRAEKAAPGTIVWKTEQLIEDLAALPDLGDEKGKPFKITVANLDKLDIRNVTAIHQAIEDDIEGKKSQPAD